MNAENQSDTPLLMKLSGRGGGDADGDCGRILDKVKTCDAALIGKMKLSE